MKVLKEDLCYLFYGTKLHCDVILKYPAMSSIWNMINPLEKIINNMMGHNHNWEIVASYRWKLEDLKLDRDLEAWFVIECTECSKVTDAYRPTSRVYPHLSSYIVNLDYKENLIVWLA